MYGLSFMIRKDCFSFCLLWVRILRILWNIFIISKIFFFFAYDASYSFFTHDTKKKKGFLPSPPPKKKTDKGFRVQIMQLLGEELPCQQSASNWCTAAGAGRASLECWGRRGQHGAGVWCGPRSSPVHAGCWQWTPAVHRPDSSQPSL